ncbi:polyprenyl synthetase family protein [Micromonospora sp. NPDC050417]|uniref:polyprenyl synthetase family protein n=1 Tax=Micromonospora sp. NPDC050417 TaxID=3364280 RepID=UPI00378C2737
MTAIAGTDPRDFLKDLTSSRAARLLRDALDDRWPATTDTADRLSTIHRYALLPAGKLIRPILMLESAAAVGGRPEDILPAALGLEYLHVATLVHDDIIDADEMRRGRPAVPLVYGLPDAIVAGDALIFTAFESITECRAAGVSDSAIGTAIAVLARAGTDLCRGQVLEAQLVGDPGIDVATYLEMIRLKTGALFRAVCEIGAILAGAEPGHCRQLASYGEHLGVAFQIRDDLLAYTTPAAVAGKSPTNDLANGRTTLPVLLAYQAGNRAQRRRLVEALNRRSADAAALEDFHRLLHETGALERAPDHVTEHIRRARNQLSTLESSPSVAVLAGITHWATARQW